MVEVLLYRNSSIPTGVVFADEILKLRQELVLNGQDEELDELYRVVFGAASEIFDHFDSLLGSFVD